jgi:hypothetical protein
MSSHDRGVTRSLTGPVLYSSTHNAKCAPSVFTAIDKSCELRQMQNRER